jgi:hypothetical protein
MKRIHYIVVFIMSTAIYAQSVFPVLKSRTILQEPPVDQSSSYIMFYNKVVPQYEDIAVGIEAVAFYPKGGSNKVNGIYLPGKNIIWEVLLPTPFYWYVQMGSVCVVCSSSWITAIDITNGHIRWQYDGTAIQYDSFTLAAEQFFSSSPDFTNLMGLCVNAAGDEVSILDFVAGRILALNAAGTVTRNIYVDNDVRGLFNTKTPEQQSRIFYFNDGYVITGDKRVGIISPNGKLSTIFRNNSERPIMLVTDLDSDSVDEVIVGEKNGDLLFLDANLNLLHKTKLHKGLCDAERQGNDLLFYDSSTIYALDLAGTLKWQYQDDGKKTSAFVVSLSPTILGCAVCVPGAEQYFCIRLINKIVILDRITGKKTGEFIYDSGDVDTSNLLESAKLSWYPLFTNRNGKLFMIASSLRTSTDPGPFGKKHFSVTEYLYELELH